MLKATRESLELTLAAISTYLLNLEKTKYGSLSEFSREHKIPNWMITRLKNRHPGDTYTPIARNIIKILKAMLRTPPMLAQPEKTIDRSLFPGMEENISIVFQIVDILASRKSLDPNLVSMFLTLVATLHNQALASQGKTPQG